MTDRLIPDSGDVPLTLTITRNERHDIYTPLNQIIGYCELIIEEAGDENPAPAHVETVRKVLAAARDLERRLKKALSGTAP